MNQKFEKSQILMISLLAALLAITPFLLSSLRSTYLYFIFNLVIVGVAVDAGFLSVLSKPLEEIKPVVSVAIKPSVASAAEALQEDKATALELSEKTKAALKVIKKALAEKVVRGVNKVDEEVIKKFPPFPIPSFPIPSLPSLFFIRGGESQAQERAAEEEEEEEEEEVVEEEEEFESEGEEEVMVPSEQELFIKSEIFIGNFYKQLKMQKAC